MKQSDSASLVRSDLNEFLFAPVGEEQNGMTLSVLSGLARLGFDPWEEAARLANLSGSAATDALAQTIAGMSGAGLQPLDPRGIAARLVRLLPKHGVGSPADATPSSPSQKTPKRASALLIWLLLGALAIVTIATYRTSLFGSGREEAPISSDRRP